MLGKHHARIVLVPAGGSQVHTLSQMYTQPHAAHSLDVDEVFTTLRTSNHKGLTFEEANQRLKNFGGNAMQASKSKGLLHSIWEQFEDRKIGKSTGRESVDRSV